MDNKEMSVLTLTVNLPKIIKGLSDITEQLNRQNNILNKIAKSLEKDSIISIQCTTTAGINRSITIGVNNLIEDWENECNVCPENDAKVSSAIINGKELIGNKLPNKSNFENLMEYLISGKVNKPKKLTIKELKDTFKKDGWKFLNKEKVEFKNVESTEQFIFKKSVGTKTSVVWLSFNSFDDTKHYYYETELTNSENNAYDSFGNVSDDYKSLQDILKVLNDNIEEF